MARILLILLVAVFFSGVMPVNADAVIHDYILPVNGSFVVTQGPGGGYSHHDPNSTIYAWDLAGSGVPVSVADGGVISKVGFERWGYGNYVVINYPGGLSSIYAHLAYASVSVGQNVSRGQQIGVIDSTGASTGDHLHFSFFKNGIPYSSDGLIDFSGLKGGVIDKAFNFFFPKMGGAAAEPLKPIDFKPISDMVAKFYNWALGIGSMVALGIVIWGGILYISAAGSDSRLKESKEWIKSAIYGLLLLLLSYLLLHTINPCLVGAGAGCT
jgi:hypothetical protein